MPAPSFTPRSFTITDLAATCLQARAQADRQLANFSRQPHADEIWQVVDKYTQALRQTEEQDLLSECRAHARLGHVFDKYLKMRSKAVQNCKRAVQLAHHIKPHPVGHDWYMVSFPVCVYTCLLCLHWSVYLLVPLSVHASVHAPLACPSSVCVCKCTRTFGPLTE